MVKAQEISVVNGQIT